MSTRCWGEFFHCGSDVKKCEVWVIPERRNVLHLYFFIQHKLPFNWNFQFRLWIFHRNQCFIEKKTIFIFYLLRRLNRLVTVWWAGSVCVQQDITFLNIPYSCVSPASRFSMKGQTNLSQLTGGCDGKVSRLSTPPQTRCPTQRVNTLIGKPRTTSWFFLAFWSSSFIENNSNKIEQQYFCFHHRTGMVCFLLQFHIGTTGYSVVVNCCNTLNYRC